MFEKHTLNKEKRKIHFESLQKSETYTQKNDEISRQFVFSKFPVVINYSTLINKAIFDYHMTQKSLGQWITSTSVFYDVFWCAAHKDNSSYWGKMPLHIKNTTTCVLEIRSQKRIWIVITTKSYQKKTKTKKQPLPPQKNKKQKKEKKNTPPPPPPSPKSQPIVRQ